MKTFVVSAIAALTVVASSAAHAQDAATALPPAYMIGSYDIRDEAGFADYLKAAAPLVAQYGGRVSSTTPRSKPSRERRGR